MLHIYAALAEKERVLIADRTWAALAQKKARGSRRVGGVHPFGRSPQDHRRRPQTPPSCA
jgi:DNA invertase Pin-like site-specific DNA recombinase